MAEEPDKDSKTEEPTEKKIRDAFERGFVPVSREVATLASLLGMLVISSFFLVGGVAHINLSLRRLLDNPGGWSLQNSADAIGLFHTIAMDALRLLLPAVVCSAGILSSLLQNAPRLVLERIRPQLSRLPSAVGKRVFGVQGPDRVPQGRVQAGAVSFSRLPAAAIGPERRDERHDHGVRRRCRLDPDLGHSSSPPWPSPPSFSSPPTSSGRLFRPARLADDAPGGQGRAQAGGRRPDRQGAAAFSLARPPAQAHARRRAQGHARHRQPDALRGGVALCRAEGRAPLVVAKGQRLIALRIREVATEHGIPVIENKTLAQSLYRSVEVDKMIPAEFYKAVAEIVFFLLARQAQTRPIG
jgi:flagellar biosynthetic protein FlhB